MPTTVGISSARRSVVSAVMLKPDRRIDRLGDGRHVGAEAFLRGLVVVGAHDQQAVGAGLRRLAREDQALARRVVAGAHDDGHAAVHMLQRQLHDAAAFVGPDRGVFAGGAQHHERIDAAFDLAIDQPA